MDPQSILLQPVCQQHTNRGQSGKTQEKEKHAEEVGAEGEDDVSGGGGSAEDHGRGQAAAGVLPGPAARPPTGVDARLWGTVSVHLN